MRDPHKRGDKQEGGRVSRRRWLAALGVGGATALAGCAGGETGETATTTETATETEGDAVGEATETATEVSDLPEVSGTYTDVISNPIDTLNPLYNTEATASGVISQTLNNNYAFKPGNRVLNKTWERFETVDDGSVWVGELRDNLQFSDPYGQVTAEDYVYQVQELQKAEWTATADSDSWTEAVSVSQTGELEVQIELENSNILYPETYDPVLYPIPKDLVQPYVKEEDAEGLKQDTELNELQFTGNLGPYSIKEWDRTNAIRLTRNEDFYLQEATDEFQLFENAPYFESYTVQVVKEQSSRLGALETGSVDAAGIPPNQISKFRDLDNVNVEIIPQPYNVPLVYNMRANGWNAGPGNLFRDKKFRQGLGCAVDKKRLVEGVYRGTAQPEYTWQPRWSKWYPGDDNLMKFGDRDGELYGKEATQSRIKQAIDDTEYAYQGDTLVGPGGDQVSLSLYHSAGQNTEKATAEFVAQEFADNVGIDVRVEAINGSEFASKYWQQQIPENADSLEWSNGANNAGPRDVATSENGWDMSLVYGLNTYPLNPTTGSVFFIKDSFYNPYGYYPSWDAKETFEAAQTASTEAELTEAINKAFTRIAEDQPMGMLVFTPDQAGYASGIQGPVENFHNGWNQAGWYREE